MKKTQNQTYTDTIQQGDFSLGTFVPLDDRFTDDRGQITNLMLNPVASIARISSHRGTIRANHYHLTDWHFSFVEQGQILYFERLIGSNEIPEPKVVNEGSMFFTPPNVEHAMLFTKETVFFTFAKNVRSHGNHEADLVRVTFVTQEVAESYLQKFR
jgi:quercetin dioxygenase-like cupin family protein